MAAAAPVPCWMTRFGGASPNARSIHGTGNDQPAPCPSIFEVEASHQVNGLGNARLQVKVVLDVHDAIFNGSNVPISHGRASP